MLDRRAGRAPTTQHCAWDALDASDERNQVDWLHASIRHTPREAGAACETGHALSAVAALHNETYLRCDESHAAGHLLHPACIEWSALSVVLCFALTAGLSAPGGVRPGGRRRLAARRSAARADASGGRALHRR